MKKIFTPLAIEKLRAHNQKRQASNKSFANDSLSSWRTMKRHSRCIHSHSRQRSFVCKQGVGHLILSPKQVAERWMCSAATVRNEIHRGNLRAFRIGMRRMGIHEADVEAYEQSLFSMRPTANRNLEAQA